MGSQSAGRTEVDPSSPEWQKYYAEASRRRRARRKIEGNRQKSLHEDRRRRRTFETVFMLGSIVFMGILIAIFHRVLTR